MIAGLNSAVRGLLIGFLYLKMGQSVVIQVPENHLLREGGFCGEYHCGTEAKTAFGGGNMLSL